MAGQKPGFRGSVSERFWAKVQKSDGCWNWTASFNRNGYGSFKDLGQSGAHRVSYALAYGPIPAGQSVCHRCDNRACVRPDHLFLGDARDNILDCVRKGRLYKNSDRCCPNGHEYPEGSRRCAICLAAKETRHCARRRQRTAAIAHRKTWCQRGHRRTEANTLVRPNGSMMCRECRAGVMRRYRAKKSAQRRAA